MEAAATPSSSLAHGFFLPEMHRDKGRYCQPRVPGLDARQLPNFLVVVGWLDDDLAGTVAVRAIPGAEVTRTSTLWAEHVRLVSILNVLRHRLSTFERECNPVFPRRGACQIGRTR